MKRVMFSLLALIAAVSVTAQTKISGTVTDTSGKPVPGVVVSDGFSCTQTDAKGRYKIQASKDAFHVFYSVPAEYEVNAKDGHPDFYARIEKGRKRYDFQLKPLAGGIEKEFKLICLADPQAQCEFSYPIASRIFDMNLMAL